MQTNWWCGRKVLVTGGAGFIGSNLVPRLLQEHAEVRVVDSLVRGRLEFLRDSLPQIEFLQADLKSAQVCQQCCQGMEIVIHLASRVGGIRYYLERAGEVFRENTLMDLNVWTAAVAARVPYFFYASSAHVYPGNLQQAPDAPPITEPQAYPADPGLSYGWAKLQGEKLIGYDIAQGVPTRAAIARIIGAYGPNQDLDLAMGSIIPVLCRRAFEYPDRGPFVVLGTGGETRSYHFVTDTVEAILRSVRKLQDVQIRGSVQSRRRRPGHDRRTGPGGDCHFRQGNRDCLGPIPSNGDLGTGRRLQPGGPVAGRMAPPGVARTWFGDML